VDCDVRLRKELFFDQIDLTFVKTGTEWAVHCSDSLYLTEGDKTELFIHITPDDWKAAYAGEYSDTVTFTVSYENKR